MRYMLLFAFSSLMSAQTTLTFIPQDRTSVPHLKNSATLWAVVACKSPGTTVAGGQILATVAIQGLQPIIRELAISTIQRQDSLRAPTILLRVLTGLGAATAVAGTIQSQGDLAKNPTVQRIVTWSGVVAIGALVGSTFIQKAFPEPLDQTLTQTMLSDRLPIGDSGCATAVFFARRFDKEVTIHTVLP